MNPLVWNILLALAWIAITGSFTALNFALGLAIGFVAIIVSQRIPGVPRYTRRSWHVLALAFYIGWEIVLSNIRVTRDLFAVARTRPALISVPIQARTDAEVTLLAALVTLTPGSTAIDLSPDGTHMFVHVTNLPDGGVEEARRVIQEGFERRILEVLR
ncbi:MAG: Na+/H+ antiporter subunit E [Chloroflexi bacterium]|nr:Na+/H+ antiporter subunit E [Chloroflexota bacterium]